MSAENRRKRHPEANAIQSGLKKARLMAPSTCSSSCFCKVDLATFECNGAYDDIRKSNLFIDMQLVAKCGTELPAHQVMFSLLSCKFHRMILELRDSNLPVKISLNVSKDAVEEFINFTYNGKSQINLAIAQEIIFLANWFDVQGLQKICSHFVQGSLSSDKAVQLHNLAKELPCGELQDRVRRFLLQNFHEINNNEGKFLTDLRLLGELLKYDDLNTSEEELFTAVENWVQQAQQAGNIKGAEAIAELVSNVRFTIMDQEFFRNHVQTASIGIYREAQKVINTARSYFEKISSARACAAKTLQQKFQQRLRIPNEVIISVGGWTATPNGPSTCIETYDLRRKEWLTLSKFSIMSPRAYHGLVEFDQKLWLFGGYDGEKYFSAMFCYDLITNTWKEKASMFFSRCYVSAAVVEGKIYAIGGFDGKTRLGSVERYDPETNTWALVAPMNAVRSDAGAVAYDGKIYIVGGFTGTDILESIEIYDPQLDEWALGSPVNHRRSGLKVVVYMDKIFAVGGYDGQQRLKSVECISPRSPNARWRSMNEMITQRSNFSVVVCENRIVVMGGYEGPAGVINKTEAYDGNTDTWLPFPAMGIPRSALSAVTVSGLPNAGYYVNRS